MAGKDIQPIGKRNNIYVDTGTDMSLAAEDLGYCGKCTFVGFKFHRLCTDRPQYIVVS